MHHPGRSLLILIVLAAPAMALGAPPANEGAAVPPLAIRTYASDADLPGRDTVAAATSLLKEAGVDTRWTTCGIRRQDEDCRRPLTALDLSVRLLRDRSPAPSSGPVPLGTSFVDPVARAGARATLYLDRIDALARATGARSAVVLARALVHEAAHLVLGTTDHAETGLMRPFWTQAMLRTEADADWGLTADDARRLRDALRERAAGK